MSRFLSREERKYAVTIRNSIFANSLGWKENGPILIQF